MLVMVILEFQRCCLKCYSYQILCLKFHCLKLSSISTSSIHPTLNLISMESSMNQNILIINFLRKTINFSLVVCQPITDGSQLKINCQVSKAFQYILVISLFEGFTLLIFLVSGTARGVCSNRSKLMASLRCTRKINKLTY